ncbi:MAG: glycosyltransferase family 4 protein [Firmicutes bacterium]|nr:glycosyltransferase family 4 protein [Bacillota bacterium]
MSRLCSEKGHHVTWWTSTFDHIRKKQRYSTDTFINLNDHLRLICLHSVSYSNNVSLERIINHYGVARKFTKLVQNEQKPDIILCSLPSLELCQAATVYGKEQKVPVILDVRDLWPDLFLELAPARLQWLARLILTPMFKTVKTACAGATAIFGLTPAFVDWGLKYAGRERGEWDRDFPMGYSKKAVDEDAMAAAESYWRTLGICKERQEFIISFFGTIGRQFELETVIMAARELEKQKLPFRFVLCGDGDRLADYRNLAKDCNNVVFPGWIDVPKIQSLMRLSTVGLAPYVDTPNFRMNIPNKPIEYLSGGLPVISSLGVGVLKDLLVTNQCGLIYQADDPHSLTNILLELYNHPEQLKMLSGNALKLYQEKFTAENVYNRMLDSLESIAANYMEQGSVNVW